MKKIILSIIVLNCFYYPLGQILAQGRLDRPTFFRDGQQLMDQEIQRLQQQSESNNIEHPSQLLTIETEELRWQKFVFQDGNFSVWIPQGIQSSEAVSIELEDSNLLFEVLASHPQNYRFVAAYSDRLTSNQIANKEQLLDEVKQGIVKKTNFTLITDKNITFETDIGKELTMKNEDELISFRVYLINDRIYVLAAASPTQSDAISETIISFFDSFRLL
ncbi:hypothetical protein [Crocosphaera chwakensis]|uniref:Uncharacterized protein n=1 Tax=Crocosphaera chwakensis CCY0110 TaxID=391612 RepID=A3IX24_9CHRO|nr:hypothetical protein [Crocosphaera chwakensis]EAZ88966.1 hypothetical protein CY0110_10982 [Crocosphaera chwakensis CCY0110]